MLKTLRPKISMLDSLLVSRIIAEAHEVLEKTGVHIENEEARRLLDESGCPSVGDKVRIPKTCIEAALKTVPSSIQMFDRDGNPCAILEGDRVHFDPGSAALSLLDSDTNQQREPNTEDLIRFVRLTDALPNMAFQSTGVVAADVPKPMQDRYRLGMGLLYGRKPIVTGTFSLDSFDRMKAMLVAVRGSETHLREKPLAIFDCCPSPPLKWSRLTCQNLIDAARSGIPAELVSMPLTGATSPITLAGALVQLTAENLSGVVIHQLAGPGAPIVFGGSPAAFDLRKGTTPMGAVETMMIDAAYAQIGKTLGLPTHAYMALSDAKTVDAQAGFETGMGAVLAALAGINVVSGPGMLAFENCQSLEKLVIDNEVCGMALRLIRGIEPHGDRLAVDLFGDIEAGDHFMVSEETLKWFRSEIFWPGETVDRDPYENWTSAGRRTAWDRAREAVKTILESHTPVFPDESAAAQIRTMLNEDLRSLGAHGVRFPCIE